MKLILQPEGSTICGQCCVAMVVGKPLKSVLATFCRGGRGTSPRIVRWVLNYYRYTPAPGLRKFKVQWELPPLCILKLTYTFRETGHWVVYNHGQIYCPGHGVCDYDEYEALSGGRLTHYLGFDKPR